MNEDGVDGRTSTGVRFRKTGAVDVRHNRWVGSRTAGGGGAIVVHGGARGVKSSGLSSQSSAKSTKRGAGAVNPLVEAM